MTAKHAHSFCLYFPLTEFDVGQSVDILEDDTL